MQTLHPSKPCAGRSVTFWAGLENARRDRFLQRGERRLSWKYDHVENGVKIAKADAGPFHCAFRRQSAGLYSSPFPVLPSEQGLRRCSRFQDRRYAPANVAASRMEVSN